jgi:H+/Cl- antiporter ClcA
MSLPLIFLLYAIVGFVIGIVLYSFRGVMVTDPLGPERPFEDYTKWTVVGVLGGLSGMLTTSLFLLRR